MHKAHGGPKEDKKALCEPDTYGLKVNRPTSCGYISCNGSFVIDVWRA